MPLDASAQRTHREAMAWAARAIADLAPVQQLAPYDGWTPDLAGSAIIEAMRWVRRFGGSAGPRGLASVQLGFVPDDEAHIEEMWGFAERADDDAEGEHELILPPSARQVSRHLAALQWPADYLVPANTGSARMLGVWAVCKVSRRSFAGAVKARGVGRGMAYQLRDRGLSLISQGLARDLIPVDI